MSSHPPPLPSGPPPALSASPPAAPRTTLATAGAWVVILASVAYIVATTAIEKNAAPPGARAAAGAGFQIAARYAVGAHHLFSGFQPAGADSQAKPLLPQVDAAAQSRDEKVHAAIVAGEVAGPAEASARLDKFPSESRSLAKDDLAALRAIYSSGNSAGLGAAEKEALLTRHGWFGRLALSYGQAADDSKRRAAVRPAIRTAAVMFTALVAGVAALLTGLVLLIFALVRWSDGGLRGAYRPSYAPTGPFLEAFAVYIACMVGVSTLVRWLLGERLASSWFIIVILPFTFLWPLLRGVPRAELRAGLGWHAGRGFWREVGAGIVGYLAGLPVLAIGAAASMVLQHFSGSDTSHPIIEQFGRGTWQTARLFFLAAVWAPVVEETMFRGAFYHHLRARLPWPAAAALVAVLFAAVHPQGWAAIPVLGGIAFCFATLREWRGSIVAPTVAHAINNGAVTLLMTLLLG